MAQTTAWQIPYPDMTDPADVHGEEGLDKLAARVDALFTMFQSKGAIPGECKLWPSGTLPVRATYGHWVWADGLDYDATVYPQAAANIAAAWLTSFGKPSPGAGRFRVPDLRGVVPIGLDAMPGGARANRITRAAAITQAALTGEEVHALTLTEAPPHAHGVTDNGHGHPISDPTHVHGSVVRPGGGGSASSQGGIWGGGSTDAAGTGVSTVVVGAGIGIQSAGGGGAHENLPPSTFVPYICKLDD